MLHGAHIDKADETTALLAQLGEADAKEEREGDDAQNVHVHCRCSHIVWDSAPCDHQQCLQWRRLTRGHALRCCLSHQSIEQSQSVATQRPVKKIQANLSFQGSYQKRCRVCYCDLSH